MPTNEITTDVQSFLAERRNMIFATVRPNGTPQQTPVWYVYRDGSFFISTMTTTAKWKNLSRNPQCSGIVDDLDGRFVAISGTAALNDVDIYETAEEIVHKYKSDEEFGPYMETVYERGSRGIIRLTPDRIITREFG